MKVLRLRLGAPLLAAALTGVAIWLFWPARPAPSAAPELPTGLPGDRRLITAIWNGDSLNPIPREPMAVALLSGGDILIADTGLSQIHRFTGDGRLRRSYGLDSDLRFPAGVAVDESDRVWITDLWQRRLYQLDLANDRLTEIPPERGHYRMPGALAYRNRHLYVADLELQQVLVLETDGAFVQALGDGFGRNPGQFAFPNGIWVADSGAIYVADSNNARIQMFDAAGRFQRMLQPHRLTLPRGLAQDHRGRLHIADTLAHDIAVIDAGGQVVARYGSTEGLTAPNGMAIRGRRLYVADRGNARVLVWELRDE